MLGIGGLMGSGRTELLLHLIGLWGTRTSGTVELDGVSFDAQGPRKALRDGLVLVSEDRKRFGPRAPARHRLQRLAVIARADCAVGPFVDGDGEIAQTQAAVEDLHIKAQALDQPVATLSGGNQQKVVLGKVLMTLPKVLLLDEPTRESTSARSYEVYELINRLTGDGKAIVLVSSELGELIGMSDRIVMLCEGRIGGVFTRAEATQERLLAAAMGRRRRGGMN